MNRLGHVLWEWGLLAVFLSVLLLAMQHGRWLERADFWFYDMALGFDTTRPPAIATIRSASAEPLIVAIDEASLAHYGRWPWSRRTLAELMDRLAAAAPGPVLLDVALTEPQADDPAADARLADALAALSRRNGGTGAVLPIFVADAAGIGPVIHPLPRFAAMTRQGHVLALIDGDGVTRRLRPLEFLDGHPLPHVAWQLLGRAPPVDGQPLGVVFVGPPGHFERVSAADLLDGRIDSARLRGRIVLVGATAAGLGDMLVTPLAGRGGAMPGVEFIANVVHALRDGRLIRSLGNDATTALGLCLLWILLGLFLVTPPRFALLATCLLCGGALLGAWGGLIGFSRWWPPAAPIAVVALAYPLWNWRRLEASLAAMTRESRRIAELVAPAEVGTVLSSPRLFDPVEKRIQAVTRAVDAIAAALVANGDVAATRHRREEMLRHIAHDLRSPLISLHSLADMLRADPRLGADDPAIARIDRCARRALELSEQFILFGHAEDSSTERFGETNLLDILHHVADDLWEDAGRVPYRIQRHATVSGAWTRGDARLLHRALLNLGWNALRHGPTDAPVRVFLDVDEAGNLRLGVADHGDGFSLDASMAVRSDVAHASGFGLGLALVRRVAEKHGVFLLAAMEENRFSIWLQFRADQVEIVR